MEEHENTHCFQDRNTSCRTASITTTKYITLYIFFSLISAVIVFLNLLVIISISNFKQLHTSTNLLILSLSVSDLLVGLFVIPAITAAIMETCWVFGEYFCTFLMFTTFLCSTTSLGNLILISVDRYVAVCDPLKYHSKITTKRTKCCILFTWCCCILNVAAVVKSNVNVQVPSMCFNECFVAEGDFIVKIIGIAISLFVPFSIILTLYLKIFVVARSQARKVFSKGAVSLSGVKTVQANKSERKAAKTLGIVVINYLIFWNPLIYILFICFISSKLASYITTLLPLVNSFINPLIYAFFYPWFKVTVNRILSLKLRPS